MINIDVSVKRTPYNQMPITMVLKSIDRKLYRDLYCLECGHPFVAISDKVIALLDSTPPIDKLRETEQVVEARCRFHYCRQYYRMLV